MGSHLGLYRWARYGTIRFYHSTYGYWLSPYWLAAGNGGVPGMPLVRYARWSRS